MRLVAALLILMVMNGCASGYQYPNPITDGISCTVLAQMGEEFQTIQISRSGENYESVFLHTDGSKGMSVSISPSGCFIGVYNVKKQVDVKYISHSVPLLVYTALNHNFADDVYENGAYKCVDTCGEFKVYVGEDGVISKINFSDYNYICDFNYNKAAK